MLSGRPSKALGMSGVSKSRVRRLCVELDERIGAFLNRQIEGDWAYPVDRRHLREDARGAGLKVGASEA